MIINKNHVDERELEDGYYWVRLKDENEFQIVKLDKDHFKTFCGNELYTKDLDDLSSINLEYRNELKLEFLKLNGIKTSLKYGNTSPIVRYLMAGDELNFTLDGHLPPVSVESTKELERLNELVLKQYDLIEEQEDIIASKEKIKTIPKDLSIYYYKIMIIALSLTVILISVLK